MNFIMSYRDNEGNGVLKWLVCVLHERINFMCVGAKLGLLKANFGRWLVELWLLFLDARGFLVLHQGSAVADLIPHSETTTDPWCSGTYKGVLQQMRSCSVGKWTFKPILCFVEKETTWPCVQSLLSWSRQCLARRWQEAELVPWGPAGPAGVPRPILALLGAGGNTLTLQKAFLKTQSSGFDNFSQQTPVRFTGVNSTVLS